jgi:hypothetical protein
MLLIMGFQRETASRGALAVYTSVCVYVFYTATLSKYLNYSRLSLRCYVRLHRFNTTPSALSITGAAEIISSAIYTSVFSSD